jgi:hypothetical protein
MKKKIIPTCVIQKKNEITMHPAESNSEGNYNSLKAKQNKKNHHCDCLPKSRNCRRVPGSGSIKSILGWEDRIVYYSYNVELVV